MTLRTLKRLGAAAAVGLAAGCADDPTDTEAAQLLNLRLTHRTPHGGQGLGTGGQMTDDWIYPDEPGGDHGRGQHTPRFTTSSPGAGFGQTPIKANEPHSDMHHTVHETPKQATPGYPQ